MTSYPDNYAKRGAASVGDLDFDSAFLALTDRKPFPWQRSLYELFLANELPKSCNLPTGLGKTSVIAIWLIALRHGAPLPRRLVYIVNRRTVVDQTTIEVERYRLRLKDAGITEPLAVSTLRGQFADNREWSADPSRAAVICGTVDMIGSRLLFSGYGCGFKARPLHAGFLGQDSLIVHDEAHLEPAFQELLLSIEEEQQRCVDFRPMRVMELTATSRSGGNVFELTDADRADPVVKQRIHAKKRLHFHKFVKEVELTRILCEQSIDVGIRHPGSAVVVFAHSVEDVHEVTKSLPKGSWEQLTGTLRGLERDDLVKRPIFQRFLPETSSEASVTPAEGTVYLVCTSAGEVGVNISADHLVCDLTPFESMAQRFGRVNRFGDRDDSEIHVIYPQTFSEKDSLRNQRRLTLELLQNLNGDGSPAALGSLDPAQRQAAFTPTPTILPTSDILFDAWSLTTIRGNLPGRPHIQPYLHGIAEWQTPETCVAWRDEVETLTEGLLGIYSPQDLLEEYPLKPHELLRDQSARVAKQLAELARRSPNLNIWLLDDSGQVRVVELRRFSDKSARDLINNATVLLPPSAGGLNAGRLDGKSEVANDVADEWFEPNGRRRRMRVWDDASVPEAMRLIRTVDTNPESDEDDEGKRFWRWYELPASADTEGSKTSRKPVYLHVHTNDVGSHTKRIVERLLPVPLQRVFRIAAEGHDLGKKRRVFQTILGNRSYPEVILAKSGRTGGRLDEFYRHEFGSLLDIRQHPEFEQLDSDEQDLLLHLIAAHHGRGRPHFPRDEAFDPERSIADTEQLAAEVPRRFARLQRRFGRWGLAYLESLLRAADYAASANPSQFVEENAS